MLPTESPSLGDLNDPNSLVAAVAWLQGTLLGTIATTLAIIAVAAIGMLMFSGRVDVRRGLSVVFGCFILFGASGIAAGIQGAIAGGTADSVVPSVPLVVNTPPAPAPKPQAPYDPYAGASVPQS